MKTEKVQGKGHSINWLIAFMLLTVVGCSGSGESGNGQEGGDGPQGRSLFVNGCPVPGGSSAMQIQRPDHGMWGPQVLGEQGDFLLMNDRAAFIVTDPGDVDAYWYYGGILVDAVALSGCKQAGPERYQEFLPLAVQVDLLELLDDFNLGAATVRGFRGETAEILNDGTDGNDAVVRVRGTDDFFWLIEYTLVVQAFQMGRPKPLSSPLGIEIIIDYVLPPDSSVLRIKVHYRNLEGKIQRIIPATAHLFGSTVDVDSFSLAEVSAAGFNFNVGSPWMTAASQTNNGAWSFALEDAFLTSIYIAGVHAAFDLKRGLFPLRLGPAGSESDTASMTYLMSVGTTDGNSAERPLAITNAQTLAGASYGLVPFTGFALEEGTEQPISDAEVAVQLRNLDDDWQTLHRFRSEETGSFGGAVANFGIPGLEYRIMAHADGRPNPDPILFTASSVPNPVLEFAPQGVLAYEILDQDGESLPVRITLWQQGRKVLRIFAADGIGQAPVIPGTYEVSVTRGLEYTTFQGSVTIAPTLPTPFKAQLLRVVDTTGFLSLDGHMHAAPSPDSQVSIPDRIRTAATEGLEVAVSTDHEFIGSWQSGIDETGLGRWVATVTGCELTATVPEHINLYAVEPRFDLDARGGFVRWYQLDIEEIYQTARNRGAQIISLNHPGYLRLIQYDRLTGTALLADPTMIGLKPGAELWSWNFDVIEYMNGHRNPFSGSGYFHDWMSFHNLGHRITAVGVTDVHGLDVPGQPRTYFPSSSDEPLEFDEDEFVSAYLAGRVLVCDGAFARVEINGTAGLGDLVTDTDGTVSLAVHIEAIPEIDVTHFLVFVNCDEVLKVSATDPHGVVKFHGALDLPITRDAHVVVAGFGAERFPRGLEQFDPTGVPRFTTNPIYVDADGNGAFDPPGGKTCSYDLSPPER